MKNEAEKLGLNLRDVVKPALEQAVLEAKKKQLADAVDRLLHLMENVSTESWIKEVREWRNFSTVSINQEKGGRGHP